MPNIKVRVSPNGGEVGIEVDGVAGASCTDLTKSLESAIMGNARQTLTDEYYQEPDIGVEESIG